VDDDFLSVAVVGDVPDVGGGNDTPDEAPPRPLPERLEERRFRAGAKPVLAVPRYSIGETPICTPGNITTISALPKAGKTAFVEALMAAAMTPGGTSRSRPEQADCLGVNGRNQDGGALIHLDTEQSMVDHYSLVERAVPRALLSEPPPWLLSYAMAGFAAVEARAAVRLLMEQGAASFGELFAVLLDGVGDLVCDVNDPAECNALVGELHSLAIKYNCPVVAVIHLNPGTEKTRGHLGSQLERKGETNLRLEKEDEVVVVWGDKNRRAPIPKDDGPRFTWSAEKRMHVKVEESAGETKAVAERELLLAEAQSIFGAANKPALRWGEMLAVLMTENKLSESGARKRMAKLMRGGVITKDVVGQWRVTP